MKAALTAGHMATSIGVEIPSEAPNGIKVRVVVACENSTHAPKNSTTVKSHGCALVIDDIAETIRSIWASITVVTSHASPKILTTATWPVFAIDVLGIAETFTFVTRAITAEQANMMIWMSTDIDSGEPSASSGRRAEKLPKTMTRRTVTMKMIA
jgi:hypothetical protein